MQFKPSYVSWSLVPLLSLTLAYSLQTPLSAQAACTNPSPVPAGYAAPCPVFSLSVNSVAQNVSLTLTATPQQGTDYIYTTAYISQGSSWNPYILNGNNAYPN